MVVLVLGGLVYLNSPTSSEQLRLLTIAYEQGQISLQTLSEIKRFFFEQQLR
jgi:hypothetical protein